MTLELSKSYPFKSNNVFYSQKWPSPLRLNTSPLLTCSPTSNLLLPSSRLMSLTRPDFAQPDVTSCACHPPEHSVYTSCTTCLYRYVVSIFSTELQYRGPGHHLMYHYTLCSKATCIEKIMQWLLNRLYCVLIPAAWATKPKPQSYKCLTLTCLLLKRSWLKITQESRLIPRLFLSYFLQSNKRGERTPHTLGNSCTSQGTLPQRGHLRLASLSHSLCGGAQALVLEQTPDALVSFWDASLFPRGIHHDSAEACCSNDFLIIFLLSSSLVANLSI